MNLDLRYIHRLERVVQRVRVVRPGASVYDQPVGICRLSYETDHLAFEVRLPELEVHVRERFPDEPLYVVEGHGSVDLRASGTQGAQVYAVEDVDPSQRRLPSPRGLPDR